MAIKDLLKDLNKKYGTGIIMDMSSDTLPEVERVPVDSPSIGELLGFGGFPVGRIIEIYGENSSGKSSMAEYLCGQIQKHNCIVLDKNGNPKINKDGEVETRKGVVAYVDTENAIDLSYAEIHGLDVSKLILVQPENGEQALDIIRELAESREVDMIVLDSISATTPKAEIEGEMGDATVGLQARMFSKFFRIIANTLLKNRVTMICINQIREKIGSYGGGVDTSGGRALKFYASIRLESRRKEYIEDKDEVKGIIIACKSVKNKTAPPMVKKLLRMYFDTSFDSAGEWVDQAIKYEIIKVGGAGWCEIPYIKDGNVETQKIQGTESVRKFYLASENKESYDYIVSEVKKRVEVPKHYRVSVDEEYEENV